MLKAHHTEENGKKGVVVEAEGSALELKAELDALIGDTLHQFIALTDDEAEEGLILMMMLGMLQRHLDTTREELERLAKEAENEKVRHGITETLKTIKDLGNDPKKFREKAREMSMTFLKSIEEGLQEKSQAEKLEEEMARKILEDEE